MIHESKIIDAYIICKKADTDLSKEPVLKPGKRYTSVKENNRLYAFWIFKSLRNALESRPLKSGEHIMAIAIDEKSIFTRDFNPPFASKEIITKDFISFSDVEELLSHIQTKPISNVAVENIRFLFESEFMEKFPYYLNQYYAFVPFRRYHEEFIQRGTVINKPITAYLGLNDLLKSLGTGTMSEDIRDESVICRISPEFNTIEYLGDGKVNIPVYFIEESESDVLGKAEIFLNSESIPDFVKMRYLKYCPDTMLEKYITDNSVPLRMKALAVKKINFKNICKASDLWHCFQLILPLLTDSDEAIELALLDNSSLYKFEDLRIAVLKILQYSKNQSVGSRAQSVMAEEWFKMVRKLNENAEACLLPKSPAKLDSHGWYPPTYPPLTEEDF